MNTNGEITLAIYASTSGFGYACMDGTKLLDYGVKSLRPRDVKKALKQIEMLLDYFIPTIILVQTPYGKYSRGGKRTKKLIEDILRQCEENGIEVRQYSRDQIRYIFKQFKATSKYEIAKKIAEWFPELKQKMPTKRKLWQPESYYMGIFDALSLICTHYYITQ
ncbi:MAG: hypothetical protein WD048_13215 [Chitinophagales bacterium]